MKVRALEKPELMTALNWAAEEGWNPGIDDLDAFFAADPQGYHGVFSGPDLVACVSVVKHDPSFAFLGLYLCHPDWRGQGHGWAVWQAGMESVTGTVGLDGVVEQQANYQRSGFEFAWRNARFYGRQLPESSINGLQPDTPVPVTVDNLNAVLSFDQQVTGVSRGRFARAWYTNTSTRQSYVIERENHIVALGTIRQCLEGAKIGPLFCADGEAARCLLATMLAALPKQHREQGVYIDVPLHQPEAVALAESLNMQPVFETARMYRGQPPVTQQQFIYGLTTLELG